MTIVDAKSSQVPSYPTATVKRAERALVCCPFKPQLFTVMRSQSVALQAIAGESGVEHGYCKQLLSQLAAENALLWLITVGLLRREVDGQGITDSFRLTPLGRQIVEQHQDTWGTASWLDHLYNSWTRLFRLPF